MGNDRRRGRSSPSLWATCPLRWTTASSTKSLRASPPARGPKSSPTNVATPEVTALSSLEMRMSRRRQSRNARARCSGERPSDSVLPWQRPRRRAPGWAPVRITRPTTVSRHPVILGTPMARVKVTILHGAATISTAAITAAPTAATTAATTTTTAPTDTRRPATRLRRRPRAFRLRLPTPPEMRRRVKKRRAAARRTRKCPSKSATWSSGTRI